MKAETQSVERLLNIRMKAETQSVERLLNIRMKAETQSVEIILKNNYLDATCILNCAEKQLYAVSANIAICCKIFVIQ
jgi:hypothetical protein